MVETGDGTAFGDAHRGVARLQWRKAQYGSTYCTGYVICLLDLCEAGRHHL